jgi:ParB/RepB/Spo0J family partition protein
VADRAEDIPIDQIVEPWIVLRPVNKDSVEYLELRDSIESVGLINSVCVRRSKRAPDKYEIVDGLYRFNCAVELRLPTVPCIVKEGLTDDDVLALQVQANAIRPETKPVEFARQLKRIFSKQPGMTFAELARIVHKSPAWVGNRLDLLRLDKRTQLMVDRGEIPIANAYMLAKIPQPYTQDYVNHAKVLPVAEFKALAASVVKKYMECVQKGRMDARFAPTFVPVAHMRPVKTVQAELDVPTVGGLMLVAEGCKTPLDGWNAALRWVMHLDRESIERQRNQAQLRIRNATINDRKEIDDPPIDDPPKD